MSTYSHRTVLNNLGSKIKVLLLILCHINKSIIQEYIQIQTKVLSENLKFTLVEEQLSANVIKASFISASAFH